jgi:tRNA (guanosine-2'-O-)-methyltransferase
MSRRLQVRGRGFYGIGVQRAKTPENVGTLLRSAVCLGADFVFVIGRRFERQASDTVASWRQIPLYVYDDLADFAAHRPYDVPLVGVELAEFAKPLETFVHPERAIYLLGPEDGSLSRDAMTMCQHVVQFQSSYCLNVAAAGTVVMYDRQSKLIKHGERVA